MRVGKTDDLMIRSSQDVVRVRQEVRAHAIDVGLGLVDQTKMVTAASELARNALHYGGGGTLRIEQIENAGRRGLRLTFDDQGPGIADLEQAMRDGYSTGGGLGLGLGGAKRLSNEFEIRSTTDQGTKIVIARWT